MLVEFCHSTSEDERKVLNMKSLLSGPNGVYEMNVGLIKQFHVATRSLAEQRPDDRTLQMCL